MNTRVNLFLYGTLKRKHYNYTRFGLHDPLNGKYVCDATAFDIGMSAEGGLPRAFRNKGTKVVGEVYEVTSLPLLATLVRMEYGADYEVMDIEVVTNDGPVTCLMFVTRRHLAGAAKDDKLIEDF